MSKNEQGGCESMSCIDDAVRKTSANWRPIQEPEKKL